MRLLIILLKLTNAIGNREHKKLRDDAKKIKYIKKNHLTGWRAKAGGGYIHQFYDADTLDYLDEKEKLWKEYLKNIRRKKKR